MNTLLFTYIVPLTTDTVSPGTGLAWSGESKKEGVFITLINN